jgi:hypothetical protein
LWAKLGRDRERERNSKKKLLYILFSTRLRNHGDGIIMTNAFRVNVCEWVFCEFFVFFLSLWTTDKTFRKDTSQWPIQFWPSFVSVPIFFYRCFVSSKTWGEIFKLLILLASRALLIGFIRSWKLWNFLEFSFIICLLENCILR